MHDIAPVFLQLSRLVDTYDAYLLLEFDEMPNEMLLEPFISIVGAELFETIFLEQKSSSRHQLRIAKVRHSCTTIYAKEISIMVFTLDDSNPHISRMLIERPKLSFSMERDKLICSTSQSNKLT